MKKRTLVCFLIFTLCVLYTSIPNTVFGQEASLAQQVAAKYSELLQREDIQAVLPDVLEGLKSDQIQGILSGNPALISTVVAAPDLLLNFAPDTDPKFITLLKEDKDLQAMLNDPQVQSLLADVAAIDELAGLLNVGAPVDTPPVDTPPVDTPPVDTPPVDTPPVDTPPVDTPPVDTPPVDTPPVDTPPMPTEKMPMADPFDTIMPENEFLFGKSRLGGLSLNTTSGRRFVEGMAAALGVPVEAETLVDALLALVPPEVPFPKKQVKQILTTNDQAIAFANEASQLDPENFGNAITPNFNDYVFLDKSSKHLTSDSLHLYTRVPSANVGGVTFNLSGGRTYKGKPVTLGTIGSETISYTFRLEETLAATNLPAWPSLDTQLFSNVVLRYSQTGLKGDYIAVDMQSAVTKNGVVWEKEIGIPPGVSVYYYFEVTLLEPVEFTTLSREKLAEIIQDPHTVSFEKILAATTVLPVENWAMPDPRNLQLADRGIIDALFTSEVRAEILGILGSPQALPIVQKVLNKEEVSPSEVFSAITPKQQRRLQNLLLRNANKLMASFEASFDPLLASVFTVPRINPETESIWAVHIPNIDDGNYYLEALVHGADGNPVDQIQETFTVDTSAPEADITIEPNDANTAVYQNSEGIYVATAVDAPVMLNIMGMPKPAYAGQGVGRSEGYLFYQQVGLDAHGMPTSTWMPLTVENTMLSSRLWMEVLKHNPKQMVSLAKQLQPQLVGGLDDASILNLLKAQNPEAILALISPTDIQTQANNFFKDLGIKDFTLTDAQAAAIRQALGASVKIVDHLVPITYSDPDNTVVMPILQGMYGDYGIRAMGIDTLFNVGSYAEPTRLRVVMPDPDKASVTAASIGDRNGDGDANEPYESGTIFSNTTDGVMLTITLDKRTVHPAAIRVEYMDANGAWQSIGEEMFDEGEGETGSTFEVRWDVTDFDALVSAGDSVMVRAVAMNRLGISDPDPMQFSIKLDAGVHPVDLEILALVLNAESITKTNPDSGAPQGTVVIDGYTPQRTYPETASLKLMIGDEVVGTADTGVLATAEEVAALQQNTDFITDLVAVAAEATAMDALSGKPIYYPTYLKWSAEVDTTALEDTITAESDAARDASKDDSQYMVTAVAMTSGGEERAGRPGAKTHLSVDNVDDVAPLGPTTIVAVADVAGAIEADADGNYTVGGIVDETVPSPIATYTAEPTADPSTYASIQLVQVDADGNETMIDGEVGMLDVTTDVGMLGNGAYMIHALAVDEAGNVQTDESPQITVNVLNFRVADVAQLKVTAVDGVDVLRTPQEPIPLRSSLTFGFNVDNGSLDAEELSGSVDGSDVPSESAEDPENTFSLMVDVSEVPNDGLYTPNAVVTKRNGSVGFPLKEINLDRTPPMVEIQTPSEDATVASLPTVHATYNDGDGSGTDSNGKEALSWATTELSAGPTVGITRIHPEAGDVDVAVDQDAIETDNGTLVYTRTDRLGGGAYRVTVQVADILGNVGKASREFAIEGTPADTTPPVIAEVAPSGSINATDLASSEFTKVSDEEALIKVNLSAVVSDVESSVVSVKFRVDDKPFLSVPRINIKEGARVEFVLGPGTHTATVSATSQGGTTEHTWTFDIIFDQVAPTITSITPTGTIRAGLPTISVSANDESGVDEINLVLMDSNGKEVKGDTQDDGERGIEGITRLDFMPEEPLDEGTYTIEVRATDASGNSATAKGGFTIDFDTAAPVITMSSPQQDARLILESGDEAPTVSVTYTDSESGVNVESIVLAIEGPIFKSTRSGDTINLKPEQKSASQVMYTLPLNTNTPPAGWIGKYVVRLEVSDNAHLEGNVSEKSSGAREANTTVHEFSFFVEHDGGPIFVAPPMNVPNPFTDRTDISFGLARQSIVSIVVYDITLRPVRVLMDNEMRDAGKNAIRWDGTSSNGEDLARGVYFCQIMVTDGEDFEPEYAILKIALTR